MSDAVEGPFPNTSISPARPVSATLQPRRSTPAGSGGTRADDGSATVQVAADVIVDMVDRVLTDTRLRRYIEGLDLRHVRSALADQVHLFLLTGDVAPLAPGGSSYRADALELLRTHWAVAARSAAAAS
jgi:hypothetical protein